MSKLKVDQLEGATGSANVTINTGSDLIVDDNIQLGHDSDTTLARASSGVMSVEGKSVYMAGGTDVAVADGGTGLSALGTANQILKTNSGASALEYGTLGNNYFQAKLDSDEAMPNNAWTKCVFDNEYVDQNNRFSTGRYTPVDLGVYFLYASYCINGMNGAGDDWYIAIWKNGAGDDVGKMHRLQGTSASTYDDIYTCRIATVTSASDYFELYGYEDGGSGRYFKAGTTHFGGFRISF